MQNTTRPSLRSNTFSGKTFFRLLISPGAFFSEGRRKEKISRLALLVSSVIGSLAALIVILYLIVFFVPVAGELFVNRAPVLKNQPVESFDDAMKKVIAQSEKELETLTRKYAALTPKQSYLVINTTDNHFFLYRDKVLIREGFVSSGSYVRLLSHDEREWLFKTPKGKRTVKGKITSPVWRKPDWAFVEEGLPVPPANHPSRYEAGVLGDYALSLGDGYLIHGTLYKRFLGMPVTHGCIRLNDEDLEFIFKSLNTGSHVYIY